MDLTRIPEDLSSEEKNSLVDYVQNGCPGLTRVDDQDVFSWFQLYMSGKSYSEISEFCKCKKDLVVYMSYRNQWHEKRMNYYNDISSKYIEKVKMAKMDSINTTINAITALGKYHDKQFTKFIANNDNSIIHNLDTKILSQYYKSLEMLDKLLSNKAPSKNRDDYDEPPTVNININQPKNSAPVTIDTEVVSSNAEENMSNSEVLRALSILKRSQSN